MRKFLVRVLILLLLAGAGVAGWLHRADLSKVIDGILEAPPQPGPAPDPDTYTILSDDLAVHRQRLGADYAAATSDAELAAILVQARTLLESSLPRLMRCWLGTPWDFNGTAHEPGAGKVACGYYVSSVLQDAGFKVEWAPLAQQPSQNIVGTFVAQDEMSIRIGLDYDEFLSELRACGAGVYIVGLDSHVAFLVVTSEGEIRFIHSSGASPYCVVDESREEAHVLRASRYRVFANLTANGGVLRDWLLGTPFKTRTR